MSVFEPKTLTLRDGAVVTLRSPDEDDAPRLLDYLDAVRRESTGILFSPEDELPTLKWERDWIQSRRQGSGVNILAENEAGRMIALCGIACGARQRVAHGGDVGISIRADWCDRGLGTLLMQELIAWARRQPDIEVLTLSVYSDNPRAMRVYEKVGFTRDGQRRWQCKRDGRYIDDVIMSCWVGEPPAIEPLVLPIDERTHLRMFEPSDAPTLYEAVVRNRDHVMPWTSWLSSVKSVVETESAIIRSRERFVKNGSATVLILHEGEIAGQVYHLNMDRRVGSVELGYWLDIEHRGRGLMTKAVRAMTNYSLDVLGLHRVWLKIGTENAASLGVAERSGFTREGVLRQSYRFEDGQVIDVAYYSVVRESVAQAIGGAA